MKIPAITGIIRRRILLNYSVEPEVVSKILPTNFQPKLFKGKAIAGICLIRLEQIRPKGLPSIAGISSENSAHRIAVEWQDDNGGIQDGVFVPRRDTDSRLNSIAGGRIFPGVHHHSRFSVDDRDGMVSIRVESDDIESPLIDIDVQETEAFTDNSLFGSLEESSRFFEAGSIGYSSRPDSSTLDGLMLKVPEWEVTPLNVNRVQSAYYDDPIVFPPDTIKFDHALLMRDISHEWHSEPEMFANKLNSEQGTGGSCDNHRD